MNISGFSGVTKVIIALGAGGVLAGAIALGARGGGDSGTAPSAQVAAETPTAVPEGTGALATLPAPRKDCPERWLAYDDPDGRFSFCYPPDFKLVTDDRSHGSSIGIIAGVYPSSATDRSVAVWFTWVALAHKDLPAASVCTAGGGKYPYTSRQETTRAFAGITRDVCFTDTFSEPTRTQLDYRSLATEFPVSDGGVVRARADYSALNISEIEALAMQIIDTLLVR
jgi:hypothetical protein